MATLSLFVSVGPKGGPGMPEMLSLSSMIVGKGQGDKVALLTTDASQVGLTVSLSVTLRLKLRLVAQSPTSTQGIW